MNVTHSRPIQNNKSIQMMRKRYLAPFVLSAVFFAACGGGDKNGQQAQATHEGGNVDSSMVAPDANVPAPKGKQLMDLQDCKTCHKEDTKVIGPSFKEIAQKYPATEANEDMLAGKIIKGGAGNWGEVAMLPHPGISQEDAKEMAKYILSLSGK